MKNILLLIISVVTINSIMAQPTRKYGVLGQTAPELQVAQWIDADGETVSPILLSDFEQKTVVILAFQSWCPGCHSIGFPTIQQLVEHYGNNNDVVFLAIQTPFEGHQTNSFEKLKTTQEQYNLKIPFGHDSGEEENGYPNLMRDYKTGGTPWVIIIDKEREVVFNNFQIQVEYAKKVIDKTLN